MRLLWVKTDFLHPTTRGGQIRTLETLRRLRQRHEVHYVAFDDPGQPEGLSRSSEYCSRAYPVAHKIADKRSPVFALQLAGGLASRLPVSLSRYRSRAMRAKISELTRSLKFDSVVCDFLYPAPNMPRLDACILFQHNVEATIWKRHVVHNSGVRKLYLKLQAERMETYERAVCRAVKKVIAVSEIDAAQMRRGYGAKSVYAAPTGVDLEYFERPPGPKKLADIVFLGSMDWMPNIDGAAWFVREMLPSIHAKFPQCTFAIAGRRPAPELARLAESDSRIQLTGTIPDVRPWLFGSTISIVPLRIGGGTRLKIYEAMAARTPVVSTSIGAEGLDIAHGENIYLADTPRDFAARCIELLGSATERERLQSAAWNLVASKYSWDVVARGMEQLLFE